MNKSTHQYNRTCPPPLQLSVPSSINLLPGQIHMLKEAIELEKVRMQSPPPPAAPSSDPYVSPQAHLPT